MGMTTWIMNCCLNLWMSIQIIKPSWFFPYSIWKQIHFVHLIYLYNVCFCTIQSVVFQINYQFFVRAFNLNDIILLQLIFALKVSPTGICILKCIHFADTSFWIKFFTECGIPAGEATNYAIIFTDNRIQKDMLIDLTKEYLKDMGITVLGDVIGILKHAKEVHSQVNCILEYYEWSKQFIHVSKLFLIKKKVGKYSYMYYENKTKTNIPAFPSYE